MKQFSTYDTKNFYIKKNTTFPLLKYPLTDHIKDYYDITDDMLDNVGVTFSMMDVETGVYKIANVAGDLIINNNRPEYPDETQYTLAYKFRLSDTNKIGRFYGSFTIDFLDEDVGCGKISLPLNGYINIIITDSITRTTIV